MRYAWQRALKANFQVTEASSNGSNGKRSTCWVKDFPDTHPTDDHDDNTDTSSDDDS